MLLRSTGIAQVINGAWFLQGMTLGIEAKQFNLGFIKPENLLTKYVIWFILFFREEARNRRAHLISLNAFERHKKFVGDYILYYGGQMADFKRTAAQDKTDHDVLRENHRFLWKDEDEEDMTWEKELARKYYDKLFKEYCIADLSRYKENKFGFRWRTEEEVVSGKGQFQCGNKRCEKEEGLKSWEVNFAYVEHGEKKNALVKLRLCPECSFKLNYHHKRKEVKAKPKRPPPAAQRRRSTRTKTLKRGMCQREKSREEEFDEYFEDMFL
ncbi:hypothetical protein JOQ06_026456 [Pogonophryne albipinna]|uniref:Protein FRA10AC1 n=1 Tax=Pogonophryne albipinna TaxID=1090488 RepID=A0AAD6BDI3_9TELE|nr:hypothetical protein JOQ06_026456 [Pogonophryne albipinna]